MMMIKLAGRPALLLAVVALAVAAQDCYYPAGNLASDYEYVPCGRENTTFAQCCIPENNDVCLENGMCDYTDKNYDYRSACADQSWEKCHDPCPQVLQRSWTEVRRCDNGQWCCNPDFDNGDCCNDGSGTFDLPTTKPETTTSNVRTSTASGASDSTSSTSEAETTTTTTDGPSADSDSASDSSGSSDAGHGLSDGAKGAIGGSIGGVAAVAIAAGAWWLLRRRRRRQGGKAAELDGGSPGFGAAGSPASSAEKKADGGYYAPGVTGGSSPPPQEMAGSTVATTVESDSREVPRYYEMSG